MSCCPAFLRCACSIIASVDSAFAASMNAHVLTTIVSADEASGSSSQPACPSFAIITSLSTRFFAQPSDTNETLGIAAHERHPDPRRRRTSKGGPELVEGRAAICFAKLSTVVRHAHDDTRSYHHHL